MEVSRKRAESPISPKIGGKIPKLDTNMATENIKNTLVDVGQQFDRWCELMVIIGAITHEAFALDLLNWFERCPKLSAARRKKGILPVEKKEESDNTHNSGDGISCDKSANQSAASQNSSRPEPRSEESYKITLNDSCSSSPVPSSLSPFTSQDATIKETDEKQSKETEKCETGTSQGTFPVMVMAVPGADEAITADPSTTLQYTNQSTPNTESKSAGCDPLEVSADDSGMSVKQLVERQRKSLCVKCTEMVKVCGGEIFLQYRDTSSSRWTYATSDNMWKWYMNTGGGADDNWLDEQGSVQQSISYASSQNMTVSQPLLGRHTESMVGIKSGLKSSLHTVRSFNTGTSKPSLGNTLSNPPKIITVQSRPGNGSVNSSVKKIIIAKKVVSSQGQTGTVLMSIMNNDSGIGQTATAARTLKVKASGSGSTSTSKRMNDNDSDSDEPVIEKIEYLPVDEKRTTPIMIQSDSESEETEDEDFSDEECITCSEDDDDDDDGEERCCEICNVEFNVADNTEQHDGWWVRCKMNCGAWVHSKCIGWTNKMVGSRSYQCTQCSELEQSTIVL